MYDMFHLEAELYDLVQDHSESGRVPPAHSLLRVYDVPSSFDDIAQTASEWEASDELVSVLIRVEAGRARQRLEELLDSFFVTDLGPGELELILQAELVTFLEHAMRTWSRVTYQLSRAEARSLTTLEIVELCLFAGWFYWKAR